MILIFRCLVQEGMGQQTSRTDWLALIYKFLSPEGIASLKVSNGFKSEGGSSPFQASQAPTRMQAESSAKCRACGSTEPAIWDSDTGNAACPSCGTVDETQIVLSNEYYSRQDQNPYDLGLLRPHETASWHAVRIQGAEWHLQNNLVRPGCP